MKTIRKIAIVSLIIGLIAAGASLAMGAYKGEKWMDASRKIRVAQGYYPENMAFNNNELAIFNNIDIDSNHNITVMTGDVSAPELFYEDSYPEQTEVSVADGKLTIRSKEFKNKIFGIKWMVFNLNYETPKIVLTLPAGYSIDNLTAESISEKVLVDGINITGEAKVKSKSGSAQVKNLNAASIEISSVSGSSLVDNVKANTLTAKSTSGRVEIKSAEIVNSIDSYSTSGRVTVSNSFADNIIAKSVSGGVKAESNDADIYELKSTSGKVELIATGEINDYKFNLGTTTGKCRINGESKGNNYDTTETDADKPRLITAKSTSGNVYITINL